jgi:hyperosmotically inducible protein
MRTLAVAAGVLMLSAGLSACNSAPREPEAPPRMTNDELDRAVTGRINGDPALVAYNLDVDADADRNEVTISGAVPTQGLRMKAIDAARTGGTNLIVTDKIEVRPGDVERKDYSDDMAREARERASHASETVGDSLDDAWIHTKIRSKLMGEGTFPGSSLNVDVNNNVVTLRGSVATRADRTKAEQIARDTEGVKSVRNQVVIKP